MGGTKNFGRCVVLSDPQKSCFIAFLSDNFWGVLFYGTKFLSKNRPKIRKIFENFLKKNYVLRFKMALSGRILMNFDKVAHKTPHRLFLEPFQNLENFWEFDPQTPPQNSLFIAVLSENFPKNRENFLKRRLRRRFRALRARKFWPSMLFYG